MEIKDLIRKIEAVSQKYSKQYKIKRSPHGLLLNYRRKWVGSPKSNTVDIERAITEKWLTWYKKGLQKKNLHN